MTTHHLEDPSPTPRRRTALKMMSRSSAAALVAVLAVSSVSVTAAEPGGKADYQQYCAGCHGDDATGNGPDTKQIPMTPPPSNLTLIAKEHGGKFPFDEVVDEIDGRKAIPSHERIQMPFWGVTLQKPGQEFTPPSDASVKRRIEAMARYIEGLQRSALAKTPANRG